MTLQPLRRYPLDAAILFSDILTVPDAMGLGLYFEAGEGPRFTSPVTCKADVDKLPIPDPEDELGYVMNAVRTIRRELKGEVPLIGFRQPVDAGDLHGGRRQQQSLHRDQKMMYADPQALHALLDKLAKSVTLYLNAQIKAGAQAVMISTPGAACLPGAIINSSRSITCIKLLMVYCVKRRSPRTGHAVYQRRRTVAGSHGRNRLRCAGPRLDNGHRRCAPPCGQ